MKKLLSYILTLALLLSSGAAAASEAAPQTDADISVGENKWLGSSAMLDGRLYFGSGDEYLSYTPGEEAVRTLELKDERTQKKEEDETPNLMLASDGEKLYGFALHQAGMIYPLSVDGDALVVKDGVSINTEPLRNMEYGDEGYIETPMQILCQSGRAYFVNRNYTSSGDAKLSLGSYDLEKGGEMTEYQAQFVWRLAAYKDGKMLAQVLDPEQTWDEKTQQIKNYALALWDPAADTLEDLGDLGVKANFEGTPMVYDAEKDLLYIQGKSEVYQRGADGVLKIGAYLVPNQYGGQSADNIYLLGQGRMAVVGGPNISLREPNPDTLPSVRLTIYGSYMNPAHQKTISAMGGLPVTFLDGKWFESAQKLGQALVSGDDNIDIMVLSASFMDLKNLMSKGYAADLSGSAKLKEYTDALYPDMRDMGRYEGKLFMAPVSVNGSGLMGYYPKLFEELSELKVPAAFTDLVDLLQQWNDDMAEEHSDLIPLQSDDYKFNLMYKALRMKAAIAAAQGKEFSFADPELKAMLEAVINLNADDILPKVDWEKDPEGAEEQMNEIYNRTPLMTDYYPTDLRSLNYQLTMPDSQTSRKRAGENGETISSGPLELLRLSTVEGGAQEPVQLYLSLMFVNPKSKHLDTAIAYMEEYVKNLEPAEAAMMMPGMNGDIENPNYEQEIKGIEESFQYYEKTIKEAEGAEKTQAEKNYEEFKQYAENRREEAKYAVRKETLARFREIMENRAITTYESNLIFNNEDMSKLLNRLMQGQMPLDQFLSEADGKLRLMRLENQ